MELTRGLRFAGPTFEEGLHTVVGVAVGDGTYVTPTFKKTCTWTVSGSASGIRFVTLNLQSADQFAGGKGGVNPVAMTPVGGMGDDAYYLGSGSTEGLFVKKVFDLDSSARAASSCAPPVCSTY